MGGVEVLVVASRFIDIPLVEDCLGDRRQILLDLEHRDCGKVGSVRAKEGQVDVSVRCVVSLMIGWWNSTVSSSRLYLTCERRTVFS